MRWQLYRAEVLMQAFPGNQSRDDASINPEILTFAFLGIRNYKKTMRAG